MSLYNTFTTKNTPNSFLNLTSMASSNPPTELAMSTVTTKIEQILLELDRRIRQTAAEGIMSVSLLPPTDDIHQYMIQLRYMVADCPSPYDALRMLVEIVVYLTYKSTTHLAIETYVKFLYFLQSLARRIALEFNTTNVIDEAMQWVIYSSDERKYNVAVVAMLLRCELIPLGEYDIELAKALKDRSPLVVDFSVNLIHVCLLSPQPITFLEDHVLTVMALGRLASDVTAFPRAAELVTDLKQRADSAYPKEQALVSCLDVRLLFAEWTRLCEHPLSAEVHYQKLVSRFTSLAYDDNRLCFIIRVCVEICISQYMTRQARLPKTNTMRHIDTCSKLVGYITLQAHVADKIKVVNQALSVIVLVLAQQHEVMSDSFNQKPFLALLSSLLVELSNLRVPKAIDVGLLLAYSDTLYSLQPSRFPGFAWSWLQLLSRPLFMQQLFVINNHKGWAIGQKLVMALLTFLKPLLSERQLDPSTKLFYHGTLRYLVVLLHDFPEFLCENYMVFAQTIPLQCVQLRNMILSAFPRTMQLPDPLAIDAGLELLPESRQRPNVVTNLSGKFLESAFKARLDDYIKTGNTSFHNEALELVRPHEDDADQLDEASLSALVFYVGAKVAALESWSTDDNPATQLYAFLLSHLSPKGTYLLFNAMVDHLRYPNRHTTFFHAVLIKLFADQPEPIKERITRVLLERLIVNRPHPWGLLATFITLLKDPGFDAHAFVRCNPDIENLFDNVKRTIRR